MARLVGQNLARGVLAAEFIKRHRGGRRHVVTVGLAKNRNLDHIIQQGQDVFGDAQTFVADHQRRPPFKLIIGQIDGMRGLLQTRQAVALMFEFLEYGRQGPVDCNLDMVERIAGNVLVDLGVSAGDKFRHARTGRRSHDSREVDVASQRGAHTKTNSRGRSSTRGG